MRRGEPRVAAWLGDPLLAAVALLLALLGVGMIHSAGQVEIPSVVAGAWKRQAAWLLVAVVAFAVTVRVPLRWLEWVAPWLYVLSLGLLAAVLVAGSGPTARSWLRLGGFSLQPAEPAKLATVLMVARVLAGRREMSDRLVSLWRPLAIVLLPFALVLAQPDLGSALIFGVILICALFWAGVPLFTIFMLVSPGVGLLLGFSATAWGLWFLVVVALLYVKRPFVVESITVAAANVAAGALATPLWSSLAPYQQKRLLVFLNPGIDPRGAGWHLIQSQVAIGSGGLLGRGYGEGPQKRLAFLPEQHTDFVFSVVGEELGFVGVLGFLFLFGWFLLRVLRTAVAAPSGFAGIAVFCLFGVWFAHLVINVGMTVGLMPVTGLPLPFLSYGGSFLLSLFAGLGIVCRAAAET